MQSKSSSLKAEAIKLRKAGKSIRDIEKFLSVARSTLSGWFKGLVISDKHKKKLNQRWIDALAKARKQAAIAHNKGRLERESAARVEAEKVLDNIVINQQILDIALAMLYWGEGFKGTPRLALGNSDPILLKFFLEGIRRNYGVGDEKIRCDLHLRADQNYDKLKKYWAKELRLPLSCFKGVQFDKRTAGTLTYDDYRGVCVITIGNVAIQRKLMYLSRVFSEKIINTDP